MTDTRKKFSPRKHAHKFYISDAARALLEAESLRTTYPMSVIVDMIIKAALNKVQVDDNQD